MRIIIQFVQKVRTLYWIIFKPYRVGVRAILLDREDNIILVKHTYSELLYLPGGQVGRHEKIDTAIKREIQEEIGDFSYDEMTVFNIYSNFREYKSDYVTLFIVKGFHLKSQQKSIEIEDVHKIKINELPENTSSATKRRIFEYTNNTKNNYEW